MKNWIQGILIGLIVLGCSEASALEERLPIPQEVHDYYATQFKPKYSRKECIVRIDYQTFENSGNLQHDIVNVIVHNYIVKHEPYMAVVTISQPAAGQRIYLQFMDFCEKRFDLADGIASEITEKVSDVIFTSVSREIITESKEIGIDQSTGIYLPN